MKVEQNSEWEQVYRRARDDWKYVRAEILAACDRNEDLGNEFIERVGAEVYEQAKSYDYPEGAPGPRLETSQAIVRDIVDLHLLALEMYEAGDLTPQ